MAYCCYLAIVFKLFLLFRRAFIRVTVHLQYVLELPCIESRVESEHGRGNEGIDILCEGNINV